MPRAAFLILAALLLTSIARPWPARGLSTFVPHAGSAADPPTLLSYNVEGLPWPLTRGRTQASADIAAQLRDLAAPGARPTVVVVQEAFGTAQKAIGAEAGYRYSIFGPPADMTGAPPSTTSEHVFLDQASALHGETEGARQDSGLAIFSDYPPIASWRMAFPRWACAGYDCLANKGMLAVALRVPSLAAPLVVVDVHLNSRTASGVDDERSFAAYARQVDLLASAIRQLGPHGAAVVLAGDFNVGDDNRRGSYLAGALIDRDGLKVGASELACGTACRSLAAMPSIAHAKTIVFYEGPVTTSGPPRAFGRMPGGRWLSDHLGVVQPFVGMRPRTL